MFSKLKKDKPNLPCPFCGNTNIQFVNRNVGLDNRTQVSCDNCGAHGPMSKGVGPREPVITGDAEAVSLWNQRAH